MPFWSSSAIHWRTVPTGGVSAAAGATCALRWARLSPSSFVEYRLPGGSSRTPVNDDASALVVTPAAEAAAGSAPRHAAAKPAITPAARFRLLMSLPLSRAGSRGARKAADRRVLSNAGGLGKHREGCG